MALKVDKIFIFLLLAVLSLPFLFVFLSVFTANFDDLKHLYQTVFVDYLINTIFLATTVLCLSLLIGVGCAWLVTHYKFPHSRFCEYALFLPMAIPSYILAYVYADFFQISGYFQVWLRDIFGWKIGEYYFPPVRSFYSAVILLSVSFYPYIYLFARSAFLNQSVCQLQVARTLGCGPIRSFLLIGLSLARPAIAVGGLLVVMETLAEFGAVEHLAISTLSTGIVRAWYGMGDLGSASVLAFVLFVICLLVIGTERLLRGQSGYYHTTNRYQNIIKNEIKTNYKYLVSFLCLVPISLGFILPFIILLVYLLSADRLLFISVYWEVANRTLWISTLTASIIVLLSLTIIFSSKVFISKIFKKRRIIVDFLGLGYAIPGGVLAIGILSLLANFNYLTDKLGNTFNNDSIAMIGLSTGVGVLIYAYIIRFLFTPSQALFSGLNKIPIQILSSPRLLGAGSFRSTLSVYLPILLSSILVSWLLVFVDVVKELPATILIRPFNFDTLAIHTYNLASDERLKEAAPSCLMIILICLLPVFVLVYSLGKSRPGSLANN